MASVASSDRQVFCATAEETMTELILPALPLVCSFAEIDGPTQKEEEEANQLANQISACNWPAIGLPDLCWPRGIIARFDPCQSDWWGLLLLLGQRYY